jgi:hypothetical protein
MEIQFGEWLPDLPIYRNPGATIAKNVVPEQNGYLPFPNPVVYSTSLGGACRGAIIARDLAGNYYNYAGDASAIYQATQTSWSNVSRLAGGAYALSTEDYWEFTQFGNRVFGVGGLAFSAQAITVGAANFADLAGGQPAAKHIASVRDFLVMGNLSATATSPQMVRWCAINNPDSWTPNAATLADFQDLPGEGGWVQKIIGGEYGTVFQERAIYRMTFVGSPLIFQFDKIQTNVGAFAPQAVANYRNVSFFLSEDGFYMFDGTNVTPIGAGKIDTTFFNDLDVNYIYRIHAVIDPKRKIVAWAYPGNGNIGGLCNRLLIYNWVYRKWTRIEDISIELLLRSVTGTYTLDGLDAISTNLDAILVSLDDSQWRTGNFLISAFNSSHRLMLFNGSSMAATVETPDIKFNPLPDGMSTILQVRPIAEGLSASISLAIATRDVLTQSATYGMAVSPNSTGYAPTRATGRFHRIRLSTTDNTNFDHLQGVDVSGVNDGVR